MLVKKISASVAAALLIMSGGAAASGFALIEQSGSGLGNAYAGGAASAEDASTLFYNPAGMSRLNGMQIAVAGNMIKPGAKFTDSGASIAPGAFAKNGSGGDAGSWALVPNAYFMMELNPQTRIGLGVNAPFGLQTNYDANWMGRFQAVKSKLETININPSLSYQVNDMVSIGVGLDYQRIKADLTNARALGAIEGVTTLTGNDAAWGFNFGGLFQLADNARIGVSYRSGIQFKLSGNAYTSSALPIPGTNVLIPVSAAIKTPDTWSVSYFKSLDNKWDVMADLSRTGWSSFKELRVIQVSTGNTIALTPENWSNTWRVSLGGNYHYNSQWTSRLGIAFDQTPVSDAFRTARIPDGDRTWLSLGGQYKPSKESAVDFGYAHLFVKNAAINQTVAGAGTLNGSYKNSVDILSAQYSHSF